MLIEYKNLAFLSSVRTCNALDGNCIATQTQLCMYMGASSCPRLSTESSAAIASLHKGPLASVKFLKNH